MAEYDSITLPRVALTVAYVVVLLYAILTGSVLEGLIVILLSQIVVELRKTRRDERQEAMSFAD